MSDVKRYIEKRAKRDKGFAEGFETSYATFKIGVMLRQAREASGMTQEEVAVRLQTKRSAISRIENHADDVRLSTICHYAEVVGANLQINFILSCRPNPSRALPTMLEVFQRPQGEHAPEIC